MAQNARVLVDSSVNDMPKFVAAAVVCVFIILFVSTNSYLEPIIFLATLGISILLNMGTNLIAGNPMGTISTITSSCASILQLAISMDYSIFLMHTYYEEKRLGKSPQDALIAAMPKTLKSIMASALTTIGGFVALFFMTYGMGYDLGFVLAKGVLLSLLAVLFVQPILIFVFRKWIDKTHHDWIITPRLNFVGKTIFEGDEFVSVTLRKGGAKDPAHEVDAITGGTKTSDGVTAMLHDCLEKYIPYIEANKQAANSNMSNN